MLFSQASRLITFHSFLVLPRLACASLFACVLLAAGRTHHYHASMITDVRILSTILTAFKMIKVNNMCHRIFSWEWLFFDAASKSSSMYYNGVSIHSAISLGCKVLKYAINVCACVLCLCVFVHTGKVGNAGCLSWSFACLSWSFACLSWRRHSVVFLEVGICCCHLFLLALPDCLRWHRH